MLEQVERDLITWREMYFQQWTLMNTDDYHDDPDSDIEKDKEWLGYCSGRIDACEEMIEFLKKGESHE